MNIAVYTIAKNEEHNVAAFMESVEGVDTYVLDTGSTDKTVDLLKQHGAKVEQKIITPWRFDNARNEALEMIPDSVDVCVSIDMDETLEAGWVDKLKKEWSGNIGNYVYVASWANKEKTIPAVVTPRTRIHSRRGFEWHRRIHEVIRALNPNEIKHCDTSIVVKHYQNDIPRNYSIALDVLIEEDPQDSDARLQRAGELFEKKEWKKSLEDYVAYLKLTSDDDRHVVRNRRANAFVAMAYCQLHLNDIDSAYRSFLHGVANDPFSREAWTHLAGFMHDNKNVPLAYGAAMTADKIKEAPYFVAKDSFCWGDYPKELANSCFGILLGGK